MLDKPFHENFRKMKNKVGQKIQPPVFTGGIYRYLPAWKIRLKWQILANNGNITFLTRNTGKYDLSCKMQQISVGS